MPDTLFSTLSAVLLAGGASRRFGAENKLLALLEGEAIVRRVGRVLLESGIGGVVVVTGFEEARYREALADLPVRFVHNANWAEGMGGSITAGVAAISRDADGVLIVPGDMPRLSVSVVRELAARFSACKCDRIIVPVIGNGDQVNPVVWPRRFFPMLEALPGQAGAKRLLATLSEDREDVRIRDEAALMDMDTASDYEALINGASA